MRVQKKGKVVDIPIRQKTIVRLREGRNGTLTKTKGIVMGLVPPSDFSRAYGRQAYVCTIRGDHVHVHTTGAGDLYPVGRAKRIPKSCQSALREYEESYPSLARKKRSRR